MNTTDTKIGFADYNDIKQLQKIWQIAFGDDQKALDRFFTHLFVPENTVVYRENNKAVSVVYMLPCKQSDGKNGLYIYAVATDPEFKGHGIASKLIDKANYVAKKRGFGFTVLVPGEEWLFDFYRKNGYNKTINLKKVTLLKEDIIKIGNNNIQLNEINDLYSVRSQYYSKNCNYIEFSKDHISHARYLIEHYGKKLLQINDYTGQGYMVCDKIGSSLLIKEFAVSDNLLNGTIGLLNTNFPDIDQFVFWLPINNNLFDSIGKTEIMQYGLVNQLSDNGYIDNNPFLGMVLD